MARVITKTRVNSDKTHWETHFYHSAFLRVLSEILQSFELDFLQIDRNVLFRSLEIKLMAIKSYFRLFFSILCWKSISEVCFKKWYSICYIAFLLQIAPFHLNAQLNCQESGPVDCSEIEEGNAPYTPMNCPNIPSNPDFDGTMSQSELESYLARSLSVQGLGYSGNVPDDKFEEILIQLDTSKPKYLGRVFLIWGGYSVDKKLEETADRLCRIHNEVDENIIASAGLGEYIQLQQMRTPWTTGIGDQQHDGRIPEYVTQAFNYTQSDFWCYTHNPPSIPYPGNNMPPPPLINYTLMAYDDYVDIE